TEPFAGHPCARRATEGSVIERPCAAACRTFGSEAVTHRHALITRRHADTGCVGGLAARTIDRSAGAISVYVCQLSDRPARSTRRPPPPSLVRSQQGITKIEELRQIPFTSAKRKLSPSFFS